jgi:hypothetical protein
MTDRQPEESSTPAQNPTTEDEVLAPATYGAEALPTADPDETE